MTGSKRFTQLNAVEGNNFNKLFTATQIYLALTVFPLLSVLQFY